MAKMNLRAFNKAVRAAIRTMHVSRVYGTATPTASTDNYYTLLQCDDDPDYDTRADLASGIAECQPGARITKIRLNISYYNSTGAGEKTELMLGKDPDGVLTTGFTPENLFLADVTANGKLVKQYTMKYVSTLLPASFTNWNPRIGIRRAALKRAGVMHDGDKLVLLLRTGAGTTHKLLITGTITWAYT